VCASRRRLQFVVSPIHDRHGAIVSQFEPLFIHRAGSHVNSSRRAWQRAPPTLESGQSKQFWALGSYADGTTSDLTNTATWRTSNPVVATVSAGGMVTGGGLGHADITASVSSVTGGLGIDVGSLGCRYVVDPPRLVFSEFGGSGGDFDGDGKVDLVWREQLPFGDFAMWLMDGVKAKQGPVLEYGLNMGMTIAGVGDLDGDGKADLVWRHTQSGDVAVWLMDGVSVKQAPVISPGVPLTWHAGTVPQDEARLDN